MYSTDKGLDRFIDGYIEAMLWAELDDESNPLDSNYSVDDLAPETLARIIADCTAFYLANQADIQAGPNTRVECSSEAYAGHDFWLTRNAHGCGYWDGDWPDGAGNRLSEAAERARELAPYVGDDGKIYF